MFYACVSIEFFETNQILKFTDFFFKIEVDFILFVLRDFFNKTEDNFNFVVYFWKDLLLFR